MKGVLVEISRISPVFNVGGFVSGLGRVLRVSSFGGGVYGLVCSLYITKLSNRTVTCAWYKKILRFFALEYGNKLS
jgi:hypothetical protein